MPLGEADTRAKLIDPAIHARGWTEDLIRREETAGAIEVIGGRPRRRARGRVDYVLRVRVNAETQAVAVALIEAKAESLPPGHGLEQGKLYAACKRLNVPFVFASNGHLFVEFDSFTGLTAAPKPLAEFPTPADLRRRYEQGKGFALQDEAAKPLLVRYSGGEGGRRYYQDAAIRAVLEKLARGHKEGTPPRALLSLATGAGKTFIAVNLLKKIGEAGKLRRALFVCDRDELRAQGLGAFQNLFGSNAAAVARGKPQKNARILIATYQTLDVADEEGTANFLVQNYPENYFSHIVIDECHRSAWGKWSQVMTRNPKAVQVGLTATPRSLGAGEKTKEAEADARITADNIRHFGEPVYEYDLGQGIEDGYLAACEINQFDLFHDNKALNERLSGVSRSDLAEKRLSDARTGERLGREQVREFYGPHELDDQLLMPERVNAMCRELFRHFLNNGGAEQKAIIFCARERHAADVAAKMNNVYAEWCRSMGRERLDPYAFQCTGSVGGSDYVAELRGASRSHFVATTVDLLTTGVDVPIVRNIVFFRYLRSPIAFYQMLGRGTRLHPPTNKLMFHVYDFTDATRLFNKGFITKFRPRKKGGGGEPPPGPPEPTIQVEGFDVRVTDAGHLIVTQVDGRTRPVTVEEYRALLAAKLVEEAATLDEFREQWISPAERRELLGHLPEGGRSALLIQKLDHKEDFDLYDVLGEIGYGLAGKTRFARAEAFAYKHSRWLSQMPAGTAKTIRALTSQFAQTGTDALENAAIFQTPEVVRAGGLAALKALGRPAGILRETKARMFAA